MAVFSLFQCIGEHSLLKKCVVDPVRGLGHCNEINEV